MGHVAIDVLGDYLLAHDTYDDVEHSSRAIVAIVTVGLITLGIALAFRAAIREARGSENAFCNALRSALPRNTAGFLGLAALTAGVILCAMEGCDALLAGQPVDDLGDLFGGSIVFGGTIVAAVAVAVGLGAIWCLRRLARTRIVAGVVVAFLRRDTRCTIACETDFDVVQRLVFHAYHICRRVAGRAPPLRISAAT